MTTQKVRDILSGAITLVFIVIVMVTLGQVVQAWL